MNGQLAMGSEANVTHGAELERQQEQYRSSGYALVQQLFSPTILKIFHAQLQEALDLTQSRAFVREAVLLTKPSIEVYSLEYPRLAAFLWGLTPRVEQIAGCELMPSYAYFRVYQQGDICKVHSDRPACEHSLSLMLELSDDMPWALAVGHEYRQEPSTTAEPDFGSEPYSALPMRAGDGVMYRGVNHRHGRIEPNPNRWSAHLFMHWVDANGPYADHAFDRVTLEELLAR
jgi:hypothetical protein